MKLVHKIKQLFCKHELTIQQKTKRGRTSTSTTLVALCKHCKKPLPQHPTAWQQIKTWK